MLERQYCASAYTIDFENKKVLLMYNKKLDKSESGIKIYGL